MGERTEYAPGTFCWVDLGTPDPDAAALFYAAVLGWEVSEPGGADTAGYRMGLVGGMPVAGLYHGTGDPPAWTSYVSVADIDEAVARATKLRATVAMGPVDVMDYGRSALLIDPQGATVALWQPGTMPGASMVNDVGALTLNQLNTKDIAGSVAFYTGLFDWQIEQVVADPFPYWGIRNEGWLNGGLMGLAPDNPAPPHWLPYFTVEDIDAADASIVDAGGTVVVPVMQAGEGRILVAMDPQSAAFAVFEGRVDP